MPAPCLPPTWTDVVVCDGQSLMQSPAYDQGSLVPAFIDRALGPSGKAINRAISGQSVTELATTVATRIHPLVTDRASRMVWVFNGLQADLFGFEDPADVYAEAVSYANGIRTAWSSHANVFLVICTVCPNIVFTSGGLDDEREALNALLIADASGAFDVTVDLDTGILADYTNRIAYDWDQTHYVYGGASLAADLILAEL